MASTRSPRTRETAARQFELLRAGALGKLEDRPEALNIGPHHSETTAFRRDLAVDPLRETEQRHARERERAPRQPVVLHVLRSRARVQQREQPERCLLYTSPSPRDRTRSRMPSSA